MNAYSSINDYLMKCIKNNYRCQHCANNHDGICFFAFECFMDNMKYYDDSDDDYPCSVCFEDSCKNCTKGDISGDVDETNYDPYHGCDVFDYYSAIDKDW